MPIAIGSVSLELPFLSPCLISHIATFLILLIPPKPGLCCRAQAGVEMAAAAQPEYRGPQSTGPFPVEK